MRLVEYTAEEIKENIDSLVIINFGFKGEAYSVKKPKLTKVTNKQFKTGNSTVNMASVGMVSYMRTVYVLEKDVEMAIETYKKKHIEKAERMIEQANEVIQRVTNMQRNDDV